MTTFDFAPLFRSTVGFDRLFEKLEDTRPDWPPYNIERTSENHYRISMALAGFDRDDINVIQQGNALVVSGHKKADEGQREILHQGLALRNFRQTFNLAGNVKTTAATIEHGLLSIELVREIPEALKPRRIEIDVPAPRTAEQGNHAKLADQNPDRQRQIA